MEEIWKDIVGYEGLYQVSNLGRVKSMDRYVLSGAGSNNSYQHKRERILKPGLQGKKQHPYYAVSLCKNGSVKRMLVHRLVATAFIDNPHKFDYVNHKDENQLNNNADNLEWCTMEYNNNYGTRLDKARATLSIVMRGKKYAPMSEIARKNISEGAKRGWETRRRNLAIKDMQEVKD